MPRKQPQLAKLSRPRLHKPVARERLFRLLDERREHPVVWISGPPGAGKTTLAASYLEEAGVPTVWYQVDSGDSDPGAFFYYLKQGVERLSPGQKKLLPSLTTEYLSDLPSFARQFLRDAFARLPDEAVLVLDNYQELEGRCALHMALAAAIAEVPQGANVLVVSRADPPGEFAQSLVNRLIGMVDWAALRLTPEETRLVAAGSDVFESQELQFLHSRSGGWMAGLTLMLENMRNSDTSRDERLDNLDTLFEYFSGLILHKASPKLQEVLLKTSFLPWVDTRLAEAATGLPDAIGEVEGLHRRHLFTDRRIGAEVTYQFHALFRAFLQNRAMATIDLSARLALQSRIAAELFSTGHPEESFVTFVDAEDWAGAELVLVESAANLAKLGRWQTLEQWIAMLPAEHVRTNPWIGYWHGRSATYLEPSRALPILEVVYETFVESRDEIGQLLAATTVLEGIYFNFENLKPMDPWIRRVTDLLQRGVKAPTKEDELRANSAVMVGATLRAPMHSLLPACLQRVFELLKEPFEPNLKVSAASMLQGYSNVAMDPEAERMARTIAHPLVGSPQLSPIRALFYRTAEGYTHYVWGRYEDAFASFDAADAIVKEHGIQDVSVLSATHGRGLCERRAGLLEQAEATLRLAESLPLPATGHHRGRLWLIKSVVAFDRGQFEKAMEYGLKSYNIYDEAGFFNGVITVGIVVANMAISGDLFDVASKILGRLEVEAYGTVAQNYVASVVLNQAWLEHRSGSVRLRDEFLADALQRAGVEGARVRFRWYVNALSELLPIALARGIEPAMAMRLAREFSVPPVPAEVEQWPWPVKVKTLGQFSLSIDGQPPEYSRKLPRKVLSLLKAIIAFGGSAVPEQRLMAALWPEEDGDAAHRSLTATLHRLRKLLGTGRSIRQAGGALSLDGTICWIDALAFEQRLARGISDPDQQGSAIDLYGGAFLSEEEGAPWAVPMRERLRSKFIQAITKKSTDLEFSGALEQAIALYLRGIDADPLVENFYQGLMRSYEKLNRRTEAVSAFRRLRETLSITLGVQPSAESQRLFDSLRTG